MLEEREESALVIIKSLSEKKKKGPGTTGASDNRRMVDLS